MTIKTTQEDMIKEYVQFVLTGDTKGAVAYLKERFIDEDGSEDIKGAYEFVESVMAALKDNLEPSSTNTAETTETNTGDKEDD